ncbi:MAG: TetR/AcrR family transcriptional regulator [Chloroflexota bacterium]|nr:TetR/AcrR family transcriptional regulator [Chloroflexota bacterium]
MARKPADQAVHRDQIIRAAADVLQRNGYEAATMKDIAAVVNLTAASLYHHFKNKDALLLAVLDAGLAYVLDEITPIAASTLPTEQKLRQMIARHIVGVTENRAVGAAMVFEIRTLMTLIPEDGEPDAELVRQRDAFFADRDRFEALFREVVREGIAQGVFRPVDVPIFVKLLLGAHNWVGVWYKPGGRLDGEQIAGLMTDMLLTGLKEQ